MSVLHDELAKLLTGEISEDPTTLDAFSRDASLFEVKPRLVVSPKDEVDLEKLVHYVNDNPDKKLSLTPRAAGSDMSGGPLSESIILDMTKHFNTIGSVTHNQINTQSGVLYRNLDRETHHHNLYLPCYTSSREFCSVGGMVANNAGGEKSLTYGKTEDYVIGLRVTLADGKTYTIKPLNKDELDKKIAQSDFEGRLYKQMFEIVTSNHEILMAAKPRVSKNSAGYYLWDIWDGKTFDLCKLFVGSQGTLGIISEITFRLIKPKKHSRLLVLFLKDLEGLADIVLKVLKHHPESFESYDDHTLSLALKYMPEILKRLHLGKHPLRLATQFLPEILTIITQGMPKLVLMAEFTGDTLAEVEHKAKVAQAELNQLHIKSLITQNQTETNKYWIVRRESFGLLRRHTKHRHTAPFIDDITVTPAQLPTFLPELTRIMNQYNLLYTLAGHIGDANFHIIPLMDMADPKTASIIPELSQKVFELVFKYKGSMSGEHNDGLIRTPYLKMMYGEKIVDLFQRTKLIFDPHTIFNPGKKIDIPLQYSIEHLTTKLEG